MAVRPDPSVTVAGHPMGGMELEAGEAAIIGYNPIGDPPPLLVYLTASAQHNVAGFDADLEVGEAFVERFSDPLGSRWQIPRHALGIGTLGEELDGRRNAGSPIDFPGVRVPARPPIW